MLSTFDQIVKNAANDCQNLSDVSKDLIKIYQCVAFFKYWPNELFEHFENVGFSITIVCLNVAKT